MFVKKEQPFVHTAELDWEVVGDGVRRKIGAYDDILTAVYVEFTKGSVGNLHAHPHHQVTYIQSGSFEVTIGSQKGVLRGGDFYYIPENVKHGVLALEDSVLVDFFSPCRKDFVEGK